MPLGKTNEYNTWILRLALSVPTYEAADAFNNIYIHA